MPSHFSMGALNKQTNEYEYPAIASKSNSYKCPDCDRDVTFKKGQIKRPHFAHKQNDACNYYDRPNESQIHKDAKNLLYSLLKNKIEFGITRSCVRCNGIYHVCGHYKGNLISKDYYEIGTPKIEYSFKYNNSNKRADVALIVDEHADNDKLETCYFEICHTHATKECDRPNPWFEFDALTLINDINNQIQFNFPIALHCLRQPNDDMDCPCHVERLRLKQRIIIQNSKDEDERKRIEQIKLEQDRLFKIERKKQQDEVNRLYKLRQEEDQRKKLEQQEEAKKKLEEQQKQRELAYEAEKLNRESIIDRIRCKHPNILRIKGT